MKFPIKTFSSVLATSLLGTSAALAGNILMEKSENRALDTTTDEFLSAKIATSSSESWLPLSAENGLQLAFGNHNHNNNNHHNNHNNNSTGDDEEELSSSRASMLS